MELRRWKEERKEGQEALNKTLKNNAEQPNNRTGNTAEEFNFFKLLFLNKSGRIQGLRRRRNNAEGRNKGEAENKEEMEIPGGRSSTKNRTPQNTEAVESN